MTDTAPEIKVTLTAEDRGVAAAIKELGNQLSALKQKQNEVAESSLNLKSAFDAVISSAIVLKVIEFGKQVFETSLNLDRLAQKTGISAGFLSTFSKAAEGSGVSTEQVSVSLGRLATNITKFQQGGTQAAAAMKALGISQANLKNLSPEQAIRLVTDRLGSMHDGLQKAAIAQTLMGRGGQALLPTLNALAGAGFDKVADAAKRSGQAITDDMAANTLAAAAAMNELEGAAKGAATQFEAGLEPAIIEIGEALSKTLESDGAKGFAALGKDAGTVLRYIALLFVEIGTTAAGIEATITEAFDEMWKAIKLGGETVAAAISSGSFKAAWNTLKQGARDAAKQSEDDAGRMLSIWDKTGEQLQKNFQQLIPSDDEEKKRQAERTAKFKPNAGKNPPPDDNTADKARLALREAELQAELAIFKANNSAEEAANQEAYNAGLESFQQYFAKRRALAQEESAKQISILAQERAALAASPTDGTNAAKEAQKAKLAKLDSEISIANINAAKTQAELDAQEALQKEQHQKVLLGYQAEILKSQGRTYEAAVAQIKGEEAEIGRALHQAGLTPDAVKALVAQIEQLRKATASFDDERKESEIAIKGLNDDKAEINLKAQQGIITQISAEQQIAAIERGRIPELLQIAAAMKAAAVTPEQKQQAADFARQIDQIGAAANLSGQEMAQFKNQTVNALQGDLSTFLGSTIDKVHGIGDAFGQLANSAVGSIQKIVAQLIVQIAFQKIAAAAAAGGGGVGGLLSTLHLAGGGFVRGPGSATSDSIPARLSDGEYVMSARAVSRIGVGNLATMNQGVHVPAITGMSVPHFAEGGLVQGNGNDDRGSLDIGIGLEEGLVLKHLGSKRAGKVILRHLAANPKAAGKALSRAQ